MAQCNGNGMHYGAALLGMSSRLAAPFGAVVHVRRRPYSGTGAHHKFDSLQTQWAKGKYLGLSTTLSQGHVIYTKAEAEQVEGFIHTFHVRSLVDPGPAQEEYEEPVPPATPSHRVRQKQSLGVGVSAVGPAVPRA